MGPLPRGGGLRESKEPSESDPCLLRGSLMRSSEDFEEELLGDLLGERDAVSTGERLGATLMFIFFLELALRRGAWREARLLALLGD